MKPRNKNRRWYLDDEFEHASAAAVHRGQNLYVVIFSIDTRDDSVLFRRYYVGEKLPKTIGNKTCKAMHVFCV